MKLLKGLVVFGAGAAVGYLLATNRVEMNVNIEPVMDKIKAKLADVMGGCCCEESCECDCDCDCEDEDVVETETVEDVADEADFENA